MRYYDLRDFIAQLEKLGELKRVTAPVSPNLEMTEICDRVLRAQGPAILFENVVGHAIPVLANLFGTQRRVALGMGEESTAALREAVFNYNFVAIDASFGIHNTSYTVQVLQRTYGALTGIPYGTAFPDAVIR